MNEPAAKLSISIPSELAEAVRKRVGPRGLSRFIAMAVAHELEREQLGAYLEELQVSHGPVPEGDLEAARRALAGAKAGQARKKVVGPRGRGAKSAR